MYFSFNIPYLNKILFYSYLMKTKQGNDRLENFSKFYFIVNYY